MACEKASLAIVSGMAFEAGIARGMGAQTIYGLDPAKLESDIEHAIHEGVTHLLSFGTAAGISPEVTPGTVIVAGRVLAHSEVFETDADWAARLRIALPGSIAGDIAGVDEPLTSVEAKALALHTMKQSHYPPDDFTNDSRDFLPRKGGRNIEKGPGPGLLPNKASGAAIADMESHLVACAARRHGLAFACLRVVLDAAGTILPTAAMAATQADGSVHYGKLVLALCKRPGELPALMRLGADHGKAKAALLRCRDLLAGRSWGLELG